ncbi:MAG: SurA N-terminal domain-containing protein [Paludibacteraceae bacterium]|nr:SurA N-terminal domain-containing protein [Paludibacteraceae bacterium]
MATLQKIRNHGVILLVIVGLAMLAFILGDFLNSGSSFFNRSREYVGTIQGHKVHYTEYEAAKEQLAEVYKIETGRTDQDEDMAAQIRNQVWQMMLMDWTLRAETKKIGMDVTTEELSELCIGKNPHQLIRQRRAFMDENGQFNSENLVRFLHSLDQEVENEEQAANIKQAKTYWMYWENATRLTRMQEKYVNLLQNMITANNIDAKYQFMANQTKVDAQYVMQPYSAIADSTITVKSVDLKKLYNKQKKLYKQTPNRSVEYISFAILPSEEDFQNVEAELKALEQEMQTTEDIALVVNTNSDVMYNGFNYSEETIPAEYKDFAFGKEAQKDAFMPLTFADGTYRMARIIECGYSMPDSVQLRAVVEGEEEQEAMWYTEAMLPQNIAEPAFKAKKGEQFTVAQGMGEVTLECVDVAKATPKAKVAILERKVTPSSKTYSTLYNKAKQFIVANPNDVQFREAAEKEGMRLFPAYNLQKEQDKIGQLKQSRAIVRWAFEANEGDISDVFECGDQFIVALLNEVSDGEYRSLQEVENELRAEVIRDKKADQMMANLAKAASLEEAAQIAGTPIQNAESVELSGMRFGNAGMEPAVVGAAFATAQGQLSAPVKGEQGVYMLVPGQQIVAEGEEDDAAMIQQMNSRYSYSLPYQAISMIQDKAEIEDNRSNFQ